MVEQPTLPRPSARTLFLALVAVAPLHNVFLRAEIAWKPWLLLVVAVAAADLLERRSFPWSKRVGIGFALFFAAVLASWPGSGVGAAFWRLLLALAAGGLLLLVTTRHGKDLDGVLRVVFWSGAAMAATGLVLGLVTNGVFGAAAVEAVNGAWLVERINKPSYLSSGFVALTNWHQDPGYSALWTNTWLALSVLAWASGAVRAPVWVPALVVGGLGVATVLTYSRTGWVGLAVAVAAALVASRRLGRTAWRRGCQAVGWGAVAGLLLLGLHAALDPPGVGGDVEVAVGFRLEHMFTLGAVDRGEEGIVDPDLLVADNRLAVWREYLGRFADQPWRGIGLGTGWQTPGLQEPHNLVIQLLAETGVVGALGFLGLVASPGRGGGPVAGAALTVVAAASLTQTVLFEPVLWLALGLWAAKGSVPSEESPASTQEGLADRR